MKQEISPKVMIAVISVAVVIGAVAVFWAWRGPAFSVAPSPPNADPHRTVEQTRAMAQEKRQEAINRKMHVPGSNKGDD